MADQLYLSLWFPNFRLQALPVALTGVLRQFAVIARTSDAGNVDADMGRIVAASAYPIDWTESPTYQRIYNSEGKGFDPETTQLDESPEAQEAQIESAVLEATAQLHEDSAYEFEMEWMLWQPKTPARASGSTPISSWMLEPARVRITGFGPHFDTGSYEQNGHIRIDFGTDTPWVFESESLSDPALAKSAAQRIQQNVEKLLAFTLLVEKNCGISSRLLWTESGEPLADKLIARLQRLN
jgi:hypothetical protein